MSVVVVTVTFNASSTIEECVESALRAGDVSGVVVVDNASTDNTVELVRSRFPDVTVITSARNEGFAAGCRRGTAVARSQGADAVLYLNPDASLQLHTVTQLLEALRADDHAGLASPLVTSPLDGRIRYAGRHIDAHGGLSTLITTVENDSDEVVKTNGPDGAVMLASMAMIDDVGEMDDSYFLYWEEVEWAWRASQRGWKCLFVPNARALHVGGTATGGPRSATYEYYFLRNRLRFMHEAGGRGRLSAMTATWRDSAFTWRSARRSNSPALSRDIRHALWSAYVDFWRGRYGSRSIPTREC